ncbi:MAG: glycosyltransferase family 39 protein [Candidatus Aquicultorales bacterium]
MGNSRKPKPSRKRAPARQKSGWSKALAIGRPGSELYALLAVAGIALALRLYNINAESIWFDEGWSIKYSSMSFSTMLKELLAKDYNPPLHSILLHFWIGLFGASEWAVRSLSAVFGTGAVAMTYVLAKQLYDREAAIMASLIMALSWFQIYFSQEARGYSLLVLLTLASFFFFVSLLKERTTAWYAGYAICTSLLIYTHAFGLLTLAVQNLYLALSVFTKGLGRKQEFKRWLLTGWPLLQLAVLAAAAPWLATFFGKTTKAQVAEWVIPRPSPDVVPGTLATLAGSTWLLLFFISMPLMGAALAYYTVGKRQPGQAVESALAELREWGSTKTLLLALWFFMPLATAFAVSQFASPIYADKYFIGSAPALFIFAARGIGRLNRQKVKLAAVALVSALSVYGAIDYYGSVHKEPWRDVAAVINQEASPGDVVLFNPGGMQDYGFAYYNKRSDIVLRSFPQSSRYITKSSAAQLKDVSESKRIWVVLFDADQEFKYQQSVIGEALAETHAFAGGGTYASLNIDVYEKK